MPPGTMKARIRRAILQIDGVVESPGVFFGEDAFWVNGTQIAHFMPDEMVQIRLTKREIRANREMLRADPRIELRRNASDWLTVGVSRASDVRLVVSLAEIAAAAHRAPPGTTPKPPPVGAELERRRRFH